MEVSVGKQVAPWLDSIQKQNCIPVSRMSLAWMYRKAFARENDRYEKHIRTHLKEKLKLVALELILLLYRTREPLLIEA